MKSKIEPQILNMRVAAERVAVFLVVPQRLRSVKLSDYPYPSEPVGLVVSLMPA
jgi:hypothetical protein